MKSYDPNVLGLHLIGRVTFFCKYLHTSLDRRTISENRKKINLSFILIDAMLLIGLFQNR